MPRAVWNGQVLAASDRTVMIEGNHYFPPDAVDEQWLQPSDKQTACPWKGTASYFDVVVDDKVNSGAAWTFRDPKPKARHIADHVAFWGGVAIEA